MRRKKKKTKTRLPSGRPPPGEGRGGAARAGRRFPFRVAVGHFVALSRRARAAPRSFPRSSGQGRPSLALRLRSGLRPPPPRSPEVGACASLSVEDPAAFPYALQLSSFLDSAGPPLRRPPSGVRRFPLRAAPSPDSPPFPRVSSPQPPPPLGGYCPP